MGMPMNMGGPPPMMGQPQMGMGQPQMGMQMNMGQPPMAQIPGMNGQSAMLQPNIPTSNFNPAGSGRVTISYIFKGVVSPK